MGSRSLEAKHEKILKDLARLPHNRRCFDCDTLGPQYIITNFNIFTCTVCSGVHREFSHRCKGVSVASFKPDEIEKIKQGGNQVAAAQYLAKWDSRKIQKPTDRNIPDVKEWIIAVFEQKQFFEPNVAVQDTRVSSNGSSEDHIPVQRVSDILGQEPQSLQTLVRSSSSVQASTSPLPSARSTGQTVSAEPSGNALDQFISILDGPTAQPQQPTISQGSWQQPSAPQDSGGWEAFGAAPSSSTPALPAGEGTSTGAAHPGSIPGVDDRWATFGGGTPAAAAPSAPLAAPAAAPASPSVAAVTQQVNGWKVFAQPEPAAAHSAKPETMKELPQDLFSEPVAPVAHYASFRPPAAPPQLLGAQFPGYGGMFGLSSPVTSMPTANTAAPTYGLLSGAASAGNGYAAPSSNNVDLGSALKPEVSDPFSGLVPGLGGSSARASSSPSAGPPLPGREGNGGASARLPAPQPTGWPIATSQAHFPYGQTEPPSAAPQFDWLTQGAGSWQQPGYQAGPGHHSFATGLQDGATGSQAGGSYAPGPQEARSNFVPARSSAVADSTKSGNPFA